MEASVTLVAALVALLALDDITTDNATTGFKPEYGILTVIGVWLLAFILQMWRRGQPALAGASALLFAAAAWVTHDGLGHKNAGGWSVFWREYSVVAAAWLWFAATAMILLARAFNEWAALQTDPRIAGRGRRIFDGQPADWPAGAPSNEEHRAVTARQQK